MADATRVAQPAELEARLLAANVPSLVAVVYQLTGEHRWLEAPFRPTRSQGMDLNASGGLSAEATAELRAAPSCGSCSTPSWVSRSRPSTRT
jgi:4-hydroxyacetophenone monooxygenase